MNDPANKAAIDRRAMIANYRAMLDLAQAAAAEAFMVETRWAEHPELNATEIAELTGCTPLEDRINTARVKVHAEYEGLLDRGVEPLNLFTGTLGQLAN